MREPPRRAACPLPAQAWGPRSARDGPIEDAPRFIGCRGGDWTGVTPVWQGLWVVALVLGAFLVRPCCGSIYFAGLPGHSTPARSCAAAASSATTRPGGEPS